MKWRLLSLISIFLIGCGPDGDDLEDLEDLDALLEEAFDISKIQERGEGDQALIYAHNKQQPYTGWVKIFHPNGQVKQLWEVEDGKSDGHAFFWHENGEKQRESEYKDGNLHGNTTAWYENGEKEREADFKDGKWHGNYTEWYENGQKSSEGEYKDGNLHGNYTEWYENGQKSHKLGHKDDKLHGNVTTWYENGQKSSEGEWENGKPLKARGWLLNGTDCPDTNLQDGNGIIVTYDKDGEELWRFVYKDGIHVSSE